VKPLEPASPPNSTDVRRPHSDPNQVASGAEYRGGHPIRRRGFAVAARVVMARITAAALAWRAGTSTSRGWHRAALSVPRAISAYLITRWRAVRKSVMALSVCALPMGR
jgi:hypothetical protein